MARRVFFHIGAPKTGTTYLQRLMAANREELASQGVLYADGSYPQDRVWATEVLRGLDLTRHRRPHALGAWDRIVSQIRDWDGSAVISHEFFGACSAKQARRAIADLAPADVHLIFTARDYVRQEAAVWQERLKYGLNDRLSEFSLDPDNGARVWSWRTQDVVAILDRWGEGLPPSQVHVVTVPPPGGESRALWDRFAHVIGVDPDSCTTQLPVMNTSLGLVQAELLRRVDDVLAPQLPDGRARAASIRDLLADTVLAKARGERFSVSPERAAALTTRAKDAVQRLSAAGYDVVGSLDDLIPLPPTVPSRSPEDVSSEELLEAAIAAISDLVLETGIRVNALRAENRELRRRGARANLPPISPTTVRHWRQLPQKVRNLARRLRRRP